MSDATFPPARPKGIVCPACGGRVALRRCYRQRPGVVVRYRRCVACHVRVKTREVVLSVSPAKSLSVGG